MKVSPKLAEHTRRFLSLDLPCSDCGGVARSAAHSLMMKCLNTPQMCGVNTIILMLQIQSEPHQPSRLPLTEVEQSQ